MRRVTALVATILVTSVAASAHDRAAGRVDDHRREPVAGATVTILDPSRGRSTTVYTDRLGRFTFPEIPAAHYDLTVTHPDHRTLRIAKRHIAARTALPLRLRLDPDPITRAESVAANRWLALILDRLPSDAQRHELLQQCTSCHQLGSPATRRARSESEWAKVITLMARLGGSLTPALRATLPRAAQAARVTPEAARRVLAQHPALPAPEPAAVVTTWALDVPGAMPRDVTVHPNGQVYAVDIARDSLYRLDPERGTYETFDVPHEDAPLGGHFAGPQLRLPANVTARTGPSSLDVASDGTLWLALALGNTLARFDPGPQTWTIHRNLAGLFPASVRIDLHDRLWYTLALSNELGSFDPAEGIPRAMRLPARTWRQALTTGVALGLGRLPTRAAVPAPSIGPDVEHPAPAGLDVATDGGVWFTQGSTGRIGRINPITRATQTFDTPFPAPRHLRCDSHGHVWVSDAATEHIARFDPATAQFRTWRLPIEPAGSDAASALAVGAPTDTVWIAGANSDTLMRFDPDTETFTTYRLPRGTVVRALTVDPTGTVWGVTGNAPTWHGSPAAILRLEIPPPS